MYVGTTQNFYLRYISSSLFYFSYFHKANTALTLTQSTHTKQYNRNKKIIGFPDRGTLKPTKFPLRFHFHCDELAFDK